MDFSVISLIVLVAVVAIGFIKKVNLGFLSMGVAFILGTCGGMSAKEIANGFSASMFVTLVGVTFLFGMASANGTLVFICGVGALINVIKKLGGIDLVSNFLTGLMTAKTATPILAATSGILSWVSSTTGVVMPALFPIAADVAAEFAGSVNFVELISAIVATSFAAAISPLSTGGAIIMSSYSAARETSNEEMNKMFKQLFLLSVANVALNVLLSALGVFNLFGLFY